MHRFLLALCLAASVHGLAACGDAGGPVANSVADTSQQDCEAMQAIAKRCALTGDFSVAECVAISTSQPAACRAATHGYVDCVSRLTCAVLTDPNATNCTTQAVDVALSCGTKAN